MAALKVICVGCGALLYSYEFVDLQLRTIVPKLGLKLRQVETPIQQLVAECHACGALTPVPARSLGVRILA